MRKQTALLLPILFLSLWVVALAFVPGASQNSWSNPDIVRVESYNLTFDIDPENRTLTGFVAYELHALSKGQWVHFDSVGVTIKSARFGPAGSAALTLIPLELVHEDTRRGQLRVPLPVKFSAGDRFKLVLEIENHGTAASLDPAETVITGLNWVPPARTGSNYSAVYTQHAEMNARKVFPCQDVPNESATYEMNLSVPAGYVAVANGRYLGNNPNSRLDGKTYHFKTDFTLPTYLAAFAAAPFEQVRVGDHLVFATNEDMPAAQQVAGLFPGVIDFWQEYFNYPIPVQPTHAVVIPDSAYPYSMENMGVIFFSRRHALLEDGDLTPRAIGTVAHELVHSWLGNLVSLKTWQDYFVNEGMTTYGDHLYRATLNVEATEKSWQARRQAVMDEPRKIEETRWGSHNAEPWVMHTDNPNALDNYTTGAWFFRELENLIGSEGVRHVFQTLIAKTHGVRTHFSNSEFIQLVVVEAEKYASAHEQWDENKIYIRYFRDLIFPSGSPRITATCLRDPDGKIHAVELRQNGTDASEHRPKADDPSTAENESDERELVALRRPYEMGDMVYKTWSGVDEPVVGAETIHWWDQLVMTIKPPAETHDFYLDPRGRKFVDVTYSNCFDDLAILEVAEDDYRLRFDQGVL